MGLAPAQKYLRTVRDLEFAQVTVGIVRQFRKNEMKLRLLLFTI